MRRSVQILSVVVGFVLLGVVVSIVFPSPTMKISIPLKNVGAAEVLVECQLASVERATKVRLKPGERKQVEIYDGERPPRNTEPIAISVGTGDARMKQEFTLGQLREAREMELGDVVIAVKAGYIGIEWREPVSAATIPDSNRDHKRVTEGR